ncbi:MAG: hypothetical protein HY597_03580 [Candidatus Omnitrophica bacterium]|nr:hypothetical protein [Candidatus Omnitrophota bacterium]
MLLFEASVTVAVVTAGLIGIVSTYSAVIGALKRGTQMTVATRCLDLQWAQLELRDAPNAGSGSGECAEPAFQWTAEVSPVANTTLALATVSVAWNDRRRSRQVQLVSYVSTAAAAAP